MIARETADNQEEVIKEINEKTAAFIENNLKLIADRPAEVTGGQNDRGK